MLAKFLLCLACSWPTSGPATGGYAWGSLTVDNRCRTYLMYVPKNLPADTPVPVVLVLHGAGTNALFQIPFCGLSEEAERSKFVAVYPNGTGFGPFLTWNAGSYRGPGEAGEVDDVKFLNQLLDVVAQRVNVDDRRVYACGFSGGGMMCYRLASELSQRIAAIGVIAGSLTVDDPQPTRPVPVIHFHGTADAIVPFDGPNDSIPSFLTFRSVAETVDAWRTLIEAPETPTVTPLPDLANDGTSVTRQVYGPGRDGARVELYEIDGGGHTWPGRTPPWRFLGLSTRDIDANALLWSFFSEYSLPASTDE